MFVGNLSYSAAEADLRQAFEEFSVTDVAVITDRETGRSRGFGFVTVESQDAAAQAIEKVDGFALQGRNLRVNEAAERQRPSGPPQGFDGGHAGHIGGYNGPEPERQHRRTKGRSKRKRDDDWSPSGW